MTGYQMLVRNSSNAARNFYALLGRRWVARRVLAADAMWLTSLRAAMAARTTRRRCIRLGGRGRRQAAHAPRGLQAKAVAARACEVVEGEDGLAVCKFKDREEPIACVGRRAGPPAAR